MSLRILVADDHDVVRQGVRLILNSQPEWEICGEAENGPEALEQEMLLKPDVIVLDISMPGKTGLEVAAELHARRSPVKVVVLTMHESSQLAEALKLAGASGYVVKSHAARDLVRAIRTVLDGGNFFSLDFSSPSSGSDPGPAPKKSPLWRIRRLPMVPCFA